MKNFKNKMLAAVMTAIVVISGAVCAMAATPTPQAATARPRPAASETNQQATAAPEQASQATAAVTTAAPVTETSTAVAEKKYTTKGGAFGWFLLSVIINSILSFAIGNRFYKMSKKDSHLTSEIRALRRDVEEKFAANVGGFSEPEMDISNSNDDYSSGIDGIKMKAVASDGEQESAEDIFKRWESQLAQQRAEKRAAIRAAVKPRNTQTTEEFVESGREEHNIHSGDYQPRRANYAETEESSPEESDEDFEEEENRFDSIKSKAKELITDIFPFRED